MKKIILSLALVFSSVSFADKDEKPLELDYQTQQAIATALIQSDEAKADYVTDALSVSDIMTDLMVNAINGKNGPVLDCEKLDKPGVISCSLTRSDRDNIGESTISISGNVTFKNYSVNVILSNVKTVYGG